MVGYGTDELPAFYTRRSGFKLNLRVDEVQTLAKALKVKWDLGLRGGLVLANPVPAQFEMPKEIIDAAIEKALTEAVARGIAGKETTPFLLARITELTGGDSLDTNIELVLNNARVASELALAYASLNGKA
ncbi:hypothetical protein MASR2M78_31910 [Treponema sp.]